MRFRDIFIVIIGSFIFAGTLLKLFPDVTPQIIVSPLAIAQMTAQDIINRLTGNDLKEIVDKSLQGTNGTYGIVIKDLRTGETYSTNEHTKFDTASLYKLWVMATVFGQLKSGDLTNDQILSQSVQTLNQTFDIDPSEAEKTDGTITQNVSDSLNKMVTVSDNYSALLLAAKVTSSSVNDFINQQGFVESEFGEPPTTTPSDIAAFYEKLYNGQIVDLSSSNKMMDLLKQQQINDRIPKYLPAGTIVAHKTGELYGFKHDAGIIFADDPILIVEMSQTNSPLDAAEREAELARAIYNYFQNK